MSYVVQAPAVTSVVVRAVQDHVQRLRLAQCDQRTCRACLEHLSHIEELDKWLADDAPLPVREASQNAGASASAHEVKGYGI